MPDISPFIPAPGAANREFARKMFGGVEKLSIEFTTWISELDSALFAARVATVAGNF